MIPPVEVPTTRSKCWTTGLPRSRSRPAKRAALKMPMLPPPSRDRIWNASPPPVVPGEPIMHQLYHKTHNTVARGRSHVSQLHLRDVGTTSPALLPLFRSETQLQLLGALFSTPEPLSV